MTMASEHGGSEAYIQAQIVARQRAAVVKIQFLNFRSKYPHGLVLAVEGDEDKIVYSYWIARLRPDLAYEFFVCGGKRGARQLCNSIHIDRGDAGKDLAFLVDRDFDDLVGFKSERNVFVLERYSIENYLVDSEVVNESVRVAIPGHGDEHVRAKVCSIFEADYDRFLSASRDLNERIFVGRRLARDIDDFVPRSIAHIASIELGNVQAVPAPISELIPLDPEPAPEELASLLEEFKRLNPPLRYRGKYAMKFLQIWFERLCAEHRMPKLGLFPPPPHGASQIKHNELTIGSFAFRSPIPNGLREFIDSVSLA